MIEAIAIFLLIFGLLVIRFETPVKFVARYKRGEHDSKEVRRIIGKHLIYISLLLCILVIPMHIWPEYAWLYFVAFFVIMFGGIIKVKIALHRHKS